MKEEYWDLIDENEDKVIGKVTIKEAREKNFPHRGTGVIVLNDKNEIFIHKRTYTKRLYPGFYDGSFGGGALSGETHLQAAKRELKEEAGIKNVKLKFLFNLRYKSKLDNAFVKVYECKYNGKLKLQKEEVLSGKFVSFDKLKQMIKKKKFCPDFLEIYKKYKKLK